ncbi:MAG: aminotransferase class III-fold pyridoxal phosphate-dependent enzyme [Rhodoplanes sp.]|uniref:aminotransferase n=1 Tax=Rhodoplanes sp. TaxID=1968906 RepID=UPI0017E3FCF9|nr:aminotransferase [Rhodoplanes sp.]NVO14436.1 aminotransferase class III-fold pyridoxal phosphate-dependent enzyme [Rhodoplanes sp.]
MTVFGNQAVRDIETVLHPYTNLATHRDTGPLMLERGQGVFVYDTSGKDYIEGMSGLWCLSLGHGNEELIEAATAQLRKLSFAHLFNGKSHDPAIELAETLKALAPVPTSKVLFCNSGSEANDTQLKLVRYMNNALGRPSKKKIVARDKAYHGVTVASASLTGLAANHADFDLPIPGILRTACPHHYRGAQDGESEDEFATRLAAELEALIEAEGPETVAAFIAEPVMGAGGVVVPPASYFPKIQAVCDKYDLYVISDEVICGFGRTGKMFGCQALGFRPDSISVAKALSSAYIPIAAVTIPEQMYEAMLVESRKIGTFGHGFTYTGHPVASAVALKTLEIYAREKIVEQVAAKTPQFQGHLRRLADHPLVGNTRGLGLVGGIELVADKATKQGFDPKRGVAACCVRFAEEEGLIVRALASDTISVCPPLVISPAEIDEMFVRFDRALARTLEWVRKG